MNSSARIFTVATRLGSQRSFSSSSIPRGQESGSAPRVWVSKEREDRRSVFVGRAARLDTGTSDEIQQVLDEVMLDRKIAKSSHPTMHAWRFRDSLKAEAQQQGKSDCGESGAGTVLASLLESTDATNVLVIVTRWYGGTPLGPARFRHISSVAREALALGGFLQPPSASLESQPREGSSRSNSKAGGKRKKS